ncbi:hypothetical protein MMC32_002123 [Xylographa parallela]|nr:hypothetical protein [Xylographa parallela]
MILLDDMKPIRNYTQNLDLMDQIQKAERKTFPKGESLDIKQELRKANTELMVVLANTDHEKSLAAYMLYARLHKITLLHKVCVLEDYRRQGLARNLLLRLKGRLQRQGCEKLQLWVDEARQPARGLYDSLGFEVVTRAEDYYSPGRNGLQMVLDLTSTNPN